MPFSRLTVVDVATLNAAPQIAAFFGDFGARVIKVEPPRGDPLRRLVDAGGDELQWKLTNRNKECVTLDFTRPEGRALLERMLERADLLVAAASVARLERWRLSPALLAERHPRLVVVNLTAFGTTGPWRDRPGSGTLAEAVSGLAALTGAPDGPPTLSPVGLGDFLGVLQGIVAALTGLYARDAGTGRGSPFDVAMVEPLLALLAQRIAATAREGVEPKRSGNRFPTMAPRNAYRTADGEWVALTAGTDDLVRRLFGALGRPELAADPRFADNAARVANADALDAIVGEWIGRRSRDEVVQALSGAGVSAAAVDGIRRVLANPHLRARGDLVELEDEDGRRVVTAAPSPRPVGGAAPSVRWLGRPRGADNDAVYRDWLGLSAEELADLSRAGVV